MSRVGEKLELKLAMLDYIQSLFSKEIYFKFTKGFEVKIDIRNPNNIEGYLHCKSCNIYDEIVIDRMKEAFNEMQKDLEVLKEYE